jgi:hypothetical protein
VYLAACIHQYKLSVLNNFNGKEGKGRREEGGSKEEREERREKGEKRKEGEREGERISYLYFFVVEGVVKDCGVFA